MGAERPHHRGRDHLVLRIRHTSVRERTARALTIGSILQECAGFGMEAGEVEQFGDHGAVEQRLTPDDGERFGGEEQAGRE